MGNFQFKRFVIEQDMCAMKVGTDAVLLGAWACGGTRILDVGTGTGILALMMAQRFPKASVLGIDTDRQACLQAENNVRNSCFSRQIKIDNISLQDFAAACDSTSPAVRFDSLVVNPPFFVRSLPSPDEKRRLARHAETLSSDVLFRCAETLLEEDGVINVVIPEELHQQYLTDASYRGFYENASLLLKTTPSKSPKRCLLQFGRHYLRDRETRVECLTDDHGQRSRWYRELTEDFYLK